MDQYDMVRKAMASVRKVTDFVPEVAIVLGSGLGALGERVENAISIPSADIDGYLPSTISGHEGKLIFGTLAGKKVVVQKGRIHYYEGYEMGDVVLPIRLMCALGAKTVILSNAAGGVNEAFRPGDFMVIRGQISQFVPSPLVGRNDDEFGPRFPDMSEIYSPRLISLAEESAREVGATMHRGVYLQVSGPNYESPDEIRAFRILGADAVGMSTTVEAIAAKHMGREILGISLITNMAAGIAGPLSHEDVKVAGKLAEKRFLPMVESIVRKI